MAPPMPPRHYRGNQFMIDKVMEAAGAAPYTTHRESDSVQHDRQVAAQAKRERKLAKRREQIK